ncbi:MAG: hypothetical protein ACUVTW_13200 [Thermogutta sp.]
MKLPLIFAVVCVAALAVGAVLAAGTYQPPPAVGQARAPVVPERPSQGMVALACQGDKYQQIVVLDTAAGVLAVYHVDLISGRIGLKSVRNIQFDMGMLEYNVDRPSPRELESLLKSP